MRILVVVNTEPPVMDLSAPVVIHLLTPEVISTSLLAFFPNILASIPLHTRLTTRAEPVPGILYGMF